MSNLLYLGIAVLVSAVGCFIIWYRNRKPTSLEAGIEEFQRELRALDPDERPEPRNRGQRPSGPR